MTVKDITSAVHTGEKACDGEWKKAVVHIEFWKLGMTMVHVDTMIKISL